MPYTDSVPQDATHLRIRSPVSNFCGIELAIDLTSQCWDDPVPTASYPPSGQEKQARQLNVNLVVEFHIQGASDAGFEASMTIRTGFMMYETRCIRFFQRVQLQFSMVHPEIFPDSKGLAPQERERERETPDPHPRVAGNVPCRLRTNSRVCAL